MELDLQERASKKRKDKDAVADQIISTLFAPLQYRDTSSSFLDDQGTLNMTNNTNDDDDIEKILVAAPTTMLDARVVADRLRQGKFNKKQILSVVDRNC